MKSFQTKELTLNDVFEILKEYHYRLFIFPLASTLFALFLINSSQPIFEGTTVIKLGQLKAFNDRPLSHVLSPELNFEYIIHPDEMITNTNVMAGKMGLNKPLSRFIQQVTKFDFEKQKNCFKISVSTHSSLLTTKYINNLVSNILKDHKHKFDSKINLIKSEILFYEKIRKKLIQKGKVIEEKNILERLIIYPKISSVENKIDILQETLDSQYTYASYLQTPTTITELPTIKYPNSILALVFVTVFILSIVLVLIRNLNKD